MYRLLKEFQNGFYYLREKEDVPMPTLEDSPESSLEQRCLKEKSISIDEAFFNIGFVSNPYNLYKIYLFHKNYSKGGYAVDESEKEEVDAIIKQLGLRK